LGEGLGKGRRGSLKSPTGRTPTVSPCIDVEEGWLGGGVVELEEMEQVFVLGLRRGGSSHAVGEKEERGVGECFTNLWAYFSFYD
jgi:hypothetical protein